MAFLEEAKKKKRAAFPVGEPPLDEEMQPVYFSSLLIKTAICDQKTQNLWGDQRKLQSIFFAKRQQNPHFDNKMKTKFNHKKFACPLNLAPNRKQSFRLEGKWTVYG